MKKTRVKLDSENSLFIRSDTGSYIYRIIYDSFVLVESENWKQESSVMIFYNGETLLLQSVVDKKTIEGKFSLALNLSPITIFLEEIIYINSLNPKVDIL